MCIQRYILIELSRFSLVTMCRGNYRSFKHLEIIMCAILDLFDAMYSSTPRLFLVCVGDVLPDHRTCSLCCMAIENKSNIHVVCKNGRTVMKL